MCTRWKPSRQHELRKGSWRSHRCLLDRATLCRCRVTLDVWRFLWINKALSRANWARRSRTTRNCKWLKRKRKAARPGPVLRSFPGAEHWCPLRSQGDCLEVAVTRSGRSGAAFVDPGYPVAVRREQEKPRTMCMMCRGWRRRIPAFHAVSLSVPQPRLASRRSRHSLPRSRTWRLEITKVVRRFAHSRTADARQIDQLYLFRRPRERVPI